MYTNILILCLASYSADTLWSVDFGTSPSGWTAGSHWLWQVDSAYLGIMAHPFASGYHAVSDSLQSPDFVIPSEFDSLVVAFDHFWWGHGHCFAASEWAQSTSTLLLVNTTELYESFLLWEINASCQAARTSKESSPSYSVVDSGLVCIPLLGASPGDTVFFKFAGLAEAYVYYMAAYAYIDWNLYSFHILNYQTQQSLVPMSWGSIKATF